MPNDPFPFGDGTILQMRNQQFALDDYGTIVTTPRPAAVPAPVAVEVSADADPLVRIEQKVDAALQALERLERRLDSIDATIARTLARQ